jgi:N utilization substance protein B
MTSNGSFYGQQTVTEIPEFDRENAEVEIIEHDDHALTERTIARRIALQVLYEVDSVGHLPGEVIARHLTHLNEHEHVDRRVRTYLTELVHGVIAEKMRLDMVIQHYAPQWSVAQMAVVDRNILRMGIYELGIARSAPIGVVVDEAVDLASVFGAETTPAFINGVMGSIADTLETMLRMLETP